MQNAFKHTGSDNRYLYNGKELQTDFGLEWYDYGARFYDAALGRFISIYSLASEFPHKSPYDYAENKPVNCIDLDGLEGVDMRFNSLSALINPEEYSSYIDNRNKAIKTIKKEGAKAWKQGIEAGKNSPLKNISENGYVNGGLNMISGAYVFSAGVSSLTATPETGGLSTALGIGGIAYGSSQFAFGVVQIFNEATGHKKDLSQGPASLLGADMDKAAKTDGTFENIGEIIENVISLKTILTPNAKKAERVVNSASIILNSTNKTLDDKEKN